ncbi:MAG: hypothetical protein L0287_27730, partial [Anaerolineae bacterium]|nr:hypothetical protein [Anaerolineae bacterium]
YSWSTKKDQPMHLQGGALDLNMEMNDVFMWANLLSGVFRRVYHIFLLLRAVCWRSNPQPNGRLLRRAMPSSQ